MNVDNTAPVSKLEAPVATQPSHVPNNAIESPGGGGQVANTLDADTEVHPEVAMATAALSLEREQVAATAHATSPEGNSMPEGVRPPSELKSEQQRGQKQFKEDMARNEFTGINLNRNKNNNNLRFDSRNEFGDGSVGGGKVISGAAFVYDHSKASAPEDALRREELALAYKAVAFLVLFMVGLYMFMRFNSASQVLSQSAKAQ